MTTHESFSDAYMRVLSDIYTTPTNVVKVGTEDSGLPSDQCVNICDFQERTNYQFTITDVAEDDTYPITSSKHRNAVMKAYIDKETPLFDSGDANETGNMSALSKVWDRIKNPDGKINSNYGLMVYHMRDAGNEEYQDEHKTQWEWAKSRLVRYKNSNQAIMHFNRPIHQWDDNKDQPCTMFVQFFIRNDKLHFSSYMRSNDAVYGTPYNISYFIKLMYRMCEELQETYPLLVVGNLTHNVTSIHIYKKHMSKVKAMLFGDEE